MKFNDVSLPRYFFENEDYCYYKNQPGSAKSTSTKCGGTSSTHTDKPLTFLECLARLWAILLPLLHTWEKLTQELGSSMDRVRVESFSNIFLSVIKIRV